MKPIIIFCCFNKKLNVRPVYGSKNKREKESCSIFFEENTSLNSKTRLWSNQWTNQNEFDMVLEELCCVVLSFLYT